MIVWKFAVNEEFFNYRGEAKVRSSNETIKSISDSQNWAKKTGASNEEDQKLNASYNIIISTRQWRNQRPMCIMHDNFGFKSSCN